MENGEKECPFCAEIIKEKAAVCKHCGRNLTGNPGTAVSTQTDMQAYSSPKSKTTLILLSFFLGGFGIHRYYVGKIGTGILMTLTLGGLGIWTLIDFVYAVCGKFTDSEGFVIDK